MSRKISREKWAPSTDSRDLIAELEAGKMTVQWESDANNALRFVMWASPEQVDLARKFGGIVIQDTMSQTNRCVHLRSLMGEGNRMVMHHPSPGCTG